MWDERELHEERKTKWWSWDNYLKFIFALNGIIWVATLLIVQLEESLSTLVVPTQPLFHAIHAPGKNLLYLYTNETVNKNMKEGPFTQDINQLQSTVNAMVKQIQSLEKPLFQYEVNTTGIVITCKFGPMCLANLHHLFDNMNITMPVGLFSSNHKCIFVFESWSFHCFVLNTCFDGKQKNRVMAETVTNKKRGSVSVKKNIPWEVTDD